MKLTQITLLAFIILSTSFSAFAVDGKEDSWGYNDFDLSCKGAKQNVDNFISRECNTLSSVDENCDCSMRNGDEFYCEIGFTFEYGSDAPGC